MQPRVDGRHGLGLGLHAGMKGIGTLAAAPQNAHAWAHVRRHLVELREAGSITMAATAHAILLVYRTRDYGDELQDAKQIVPFTSTATAFGGHRRW